MEEKMIQKYEVFRIHRIPSGNQFFPFSLRSETKKEILPHVEGFKCQKCRCLVSLSQGPICPQCGGKMEEEIIVTL
jgi:rRNA maturation endonuclease Nob1